MSVTIKTGYSFMTKRLIQGEEKEIGNWVDEATGINSTSDVRRERNREQY